MSASVASPHLSRRYGKHDFQRFDNLLSHHASVGAASIGKVSVDCRFLFKKSQWGVITEAENPAGIIYLDLSFNQPNDCRLKSATVTVTLDEDDHDLVGQTSAGRAGQHTVPVQIGSYGPQQFSGQTRRALKTQRNTLIPSFNVMGIAGAGGVGLESEKYSVQESRWAFSSQLLPDTRSKKNNWAYKVLKWELTENELENQSIHSNVIHTAFSFEHDGQPFFMQVEVSGRLESLRSDLKNEMKTKFRKLKFPSNPKDECCATTLINFGGRHNFRKPLDELARSLPLAMEEENMKSVPIQIPNSQRATFHEDTVEGKQLALAAANSHANRRNGRNNEDVPGPQRQNLPSGRTRPVSGQTPVVLGRVLDDDADPTDDPTLPTTENFASAFMSLTRPRSMQIPPMQARGLSETGSVEEGQPPTNNRAERAGIAPTLRSTRMKSSDTSSVTLIDQEQDETSDTSSQIMSREMPKQTTKPIDPDAILLVLKMSGLLTIIQGIIALLSSWGIDLSPQGKDNGLKLECSSENEEDEGPKAILNGVGYKGRDQLAP